jgi:dTDP-4-amino-4,6-dideoxy-D-glucose transaminase
MRPQLALFGSAPAFRDPTEVGPVHVADPRDFERAMRGIFERRYFANNGPLVVELDSALARALDVGHAICMTNETVAMMVLLKALELDGEVVVPAFAPSMLADAVIWAGGTPVHCDVDAKTHMLSPATIAPSLTPRTVAIAGVHLWGRSCASPELIGFARERSLRLVFDASSAAGSRSGGQAVGGFGDAEVFSFHASRTINGAEGGAATTNDDELAKKLRTIRNFHPGETFAPAALRMNGKMSEAQAALALLGLRDLRRTIAANVNRHLAYAEAFAGVRGCSLLGHEPLEECNAQSIVLLIDEVQAGIGRDDVAAALAADNVVCRRPFANAVTAGFPNSERLRHEALLLPNAETLSAEQIGRIGALVREIVSNASAVTECLRSRV